MTTLATDTFTRSIAGGWGTANTGGTWTTTTASYFSTDGARGNIAATAGQTNYARLPLSAASTEVYAEFGLGAITNSGNVYFYVHARSISEAAAATTSYGVTLQTGTTGALNLYLSVNGVNSVLTATGITIATTDRIAVRVQTLGASPTTIRARVWKLGTAEPTTWALNTTDTTAGLQVSGGVAFGTFLSSSSTNGPITVSVDNLTVTDAATTNTPPTVSAGSDQTVALGATLALNGTASDVDGTIASTAWTCTIYPAALSSAPTITGASTLHATAPLTATGVYQFQLAATDNSGATATATCMAYVPTAAVTVKGLIDNSGGWTGAYTDIDEAEGAIDTSNYITSGTGPVSFRLDPVTSSASAYIWFEADQTGTGSTLTVDLIDTTAGKTIVTQTFTSLNTNSPTKYRIDLTPAQTASITDWNRLSLRFT